MNVGKRIAIVGAGRIGSAFGFRLARAGHNVIMIARGARLEALRREGAIVAVDGERATVKVAEALDVSARYDLVLVTVLAEQVEPLLPALKRSEARVILFMFNTFRRTEPWRDAIGHTRFSVGFPAMTAFFVEGKLKSVVDAPGMVTTLSNPDWAKLLKAAGLPTEVEYDMDSYLRTHVALVVPLMVAAVWTRQRPGELSWQEAKRLSAAWQEGLRVVRGLGHTLKPRLASLLAALPAWLLTTLLWMFGRTAAVKDLGEFGPHEARSLIDAMAAAAPGRTPNLLAIRP